MGFQAIFKFVKCWRAPDVVRETVPSSWGCDGERALAKFETSARDKQSVCLTLPVCMCLCVCLSVCLTAPVCMCLCTVQC